MCIKIYIRARFEFVLWAKDKMMMDKMMKFVKFVGFATMRAGAETGLPMFLVVDKRTASASEVLSAALKENGRAKLIGEKTFGKVRTDGGGWPDLCQGVGENHTQFI